MSISSSNKFNQARKVHRGFIESLSTEQLIEYVKGDEI